MIYCDDIVYKDGKSKMRPSRILKAKKKSEISQLLDQFPLTCKPDPTDERDFKFKSITPTIMEAVGSLPSKVDHTPDMSPVKDQGHLGSCVGFAVSAMKECQERKEHLEEIAKGKRGRPKIYDYSEAWIYWNAKKLDPWGVEDEGTSIRYAMQVLKKIGVPTEKGWPYKDINDVDAIGEPKRWANMVARWALIDSYWRVENLEELKVALVNGPVPIGVPCFYEIFFVGSNGLVPYPANPSQYYGGHAICAVGYDDSRQLVKFKNSWGTGWGEKGYGYLPYTYIRDFLWDAWASQDLAVTKDMLKGTRELV